MAPKPKVQIQGLGRELTVPALFCKHCVFYEREGFYAKPKDHKDSGGRGPGKKKKIGGEKIPCKYLGIDGNTTKPCGEFSPDVSSISFEDPEGSPALISTLLHQMDDKDIPKLTSLLVELYRTRKLLRNRFKFGDVGYVLMFGEDYLSNYQAVQIIKAKKEIVFLEQAPSLDGLPRTKKQKVTTVYIYARGSKNLNLRLQESSVLTERAFKEKVKELQKAGRLIDPRYQCFTDMPLPDNLEDPNYRPKLARVIKVPKVEKTTTRKGRKPATAKETKIERPQLYSQRKARGTKAIKAFKV